MPLTIGLAKCFFEEALRAGEWLLKVMRTSVPLEVANYLICLDFLSLGRGSRTLYQRVLLLTN